jgi:metal-sulfur cluster biosynthetic enzyme
MTTVEQCQTPTIDVEAIRAALHEVLDPEIGINIVDLGLVYGIDVRDRDVVVRMTMTTPSCPLSGYLADAVETAIRDRFASVAGIDVDLVWDPPWSPAMMSEAARRQLGTSDRR